VPLGQLPLPVLRWRSQWQGRPTAVERVRVIRAERGIAVDARERQSRLQLSLEDLCHQQLVVVRDVVQAPQRDAWS
jgi:hypothetical protein